MASFDPRTGMTILDEASRWDLLSTAAVSRLAVVVGDDLEIFPINTVVDDRTIVFSTGEGWSVVVKGEADRLDRFDDIDQAEKLPLHPWSGHPKQWFVRVTTRSV